MKIPIGYRPDVIARRVALLRAYAKGGKRGRATRDASREVRQKELTRCRFAIYHDSYILRTLGLITATAQKGIPRTGKRSLEIFFRVTEAGQNVLDMYEGDWE